MHAKFYIRDWQSNYHEVSLSKNKIENRPITLNSIGLSDDTSNSITIDFDPILLSYLLRELELSTQFRRKVIHYVQQCEQIVVIKAIAVDKGVLDYEWCRRATSLTWQKVEEENLMSWLSTLGGAFSALGDSFEKCADTAGKISMYQLKIALKSGDPSVVARCKLYYSISLIQKGYLRAAKQMVLAQYSLAKCDLSDDRVYKMCHGIWLKLQHSYYLRKQQRLNAITNEHKSQ